MLVISLPIYVCATASIPIAVALMSKGVSAGAVFVFLMAGPATNASSIAVVKQILGKKTMYLYLLLISTTAIGFGLILDFFLSIEPVLSNQVHNHGQHEYSSLFLAVLFIIVIINAYVYRVLGVIRLEYEAPTDINGTFFLTVGGMTCSHCESSVKSAVLGCDGVESVVVDLSTGRVGVEGENFDETNIKDAILKTGFSIK